MPLWDLYIVSNRIYLKPNLYYIIYKYTHFKFLTEIQIIQYTIKKNRRKPPYASS